MTVEANLTVVFREAIGITDISDSSMLHFARDFGDRNGLEIRFAGHLDDSGQWLYSGAVNAGERGFFADCRETIGEAIADALVEWWAAEIERKR